MITTVDFLSRYSFEARTPRPHDAAISIGDPDQEKPAILSAYGARAFRVQFLDINPEICWKHGLDINKCLTQLQAEDIAGFLRACPGGADRPDRTLRSRRVQKRCCGADRRGVREVWPSRAGRFLRQHARRAASRR